MPPALNPRTRDRWTSWLRVSMPLLLASIALSPALDMARAGTPASGVQVALAPAAATIAPGSDFYIDTAVAGSPQRFNAWGGTLVFDPQALTYLPAIPATDQEGCLMTGACSNACGSTFLQMTPGPDSLSIVTSILCYQTFLTDSGQLFHLHFRAANRILQTRVFFRSLWFTDGTQPMGPVTCSTAQVGIGMPPSAAVEPSSASGLSLRPTTNPSRGTVTFSVSSTQSGEQEVVVHDISGRLVRVLSRGWQSAGTHPLAWGGDDVSGARVRPGVYLVLLRQGGRRSETRVTILD